MLFAKLLNKFIQKPCGNQGCSGIDELSRFLNSSERVFLFIQEKDFNKVSKSLEVPAFVLEKDSVGHRDILFVSNKDM